MSKKTITLDYDEYLELIEEKNKMKKLNKDKIMIIIHSFMSSNVYTNHFIVELPEAVKCAISHMSMKDIKKIKKGE